MRSSQLLRPAGMMVGATVVVLSAGCGQSVLPESSNRGSGSDTATTTVEDAFIVPAFVPGNCAIQVDTGGSMRFTVTNNRPTESERLLGVSTDAAKVARVVAPIDIPPKATIGIGEPSTQIEAAGGRVSAVRLEQLDPGLKPAMSADVTFEFLRAGDITIPVPVEAYPRQAP